MFVQKSPIGYIPKEDSINLKGLNQEINMKELLSVPKEMWIEECDEIAKYFDEQVGDDLPKRIQEELKSVKNLVLKT